MRRNLRLARPVARLRQGRTDWYRIENKANGTAEVYIYDEIGYWGVTAKDFVAELRDVDADRIDLHLNSPGGDVFDGIAIYQALLNHPAEVTTLVDSLAASAASFIAMAGDRIVMARNAEMMIHDAFGLAVGDAADMRDMAERLDKISDNIADIYAQRAGGTVADWRVAMLAETWYSADEAVDAGLADEVRAGKGKGDQGDADAANSWDLSIYTYAGRRQAPAPASPPGARRRRPAASAADPGARPGRPRASDRPAASGAAAEPALATPVAASVAVPWDGEMAQMFRAVVAEHAEHAPAPPAPAPATVPAMAGRAAGPAAEPFIVDPIQFHNAIREGLRARQSRDG